MLDLYILYGVATIGGIATPFVLMIRDRHIGGGRVRAALSGLDRGPHVMGMLSDGPGRMVEAVATELVERGAVVADNGVLTLTQEYANWLTMLTDAAGKDLRMWEVAVAVPVRGGDPAALVGFAAA